MDINGVESLLFSIHLALASIAKTPELALEKNEARALAEAASNVARHYDLPGMPQQVIDWGNLIIVGATVYGSRALAIRARVSAERAAARASAKENAKAAHVFGLHGDAGLAPHLRPVEEPPIYRG